MAKVQLGVEPKRLTALALLLLLAGYLFYTNVFSVGDVPETAKRPASTKATESGSDADTQTASRPRLTQRGSAAGSGASRGSRAEFKPTLRIKEGPGGTDLSKIDPTLRLDRLAKLSEVRLSGIGRNLFEFGAAPPPEKPKLPEPKIVPKPTFIGPQPAPPPPPPPVKPPPPPISLKFYGSSLPVGGGVKRVFCMDGDQVLTPAEGEIIKKRYRIVRITATSVVVEDLDYKRQQTLPIEDLPRSG